MEDNTNILFEIKNELFKKALLKERNDSAHAITLKAFAKFKNELVSGNIVTSYPEYSKIGISVDGIKHYFDLKDIIKIEKVER